jgi:hypothetical protein
MVVMMMMMMRGLRRTCIACRQADRRADASNKERAWMTLPGRASRSLNAVTAIHRQLSFVDRRTLSSAACRCHTTAACNLHAACMSIDFPSSTPCNRLQTLCKRSTFGGLPIDMLLINIHDHRHFGSYLRIEFETFQFWILCKIKIENNEFPISVQ